MLLKELSEARGVSGNEEAVRRLILTKIEPLADEIMVDVMGNVIAHKRGINGGKKIMICAHMDEVGLIVSAVTDKGYLKFKTVGGVDARVLVGKKVRVGESNVTGVIALKAIHLQSKDERKNAPKAKELYIDIGVESKEAAEKLVTLGDYVSFDTEFAEFGDGCLKGKALDDRCGCAILLELMGHTYRNDIYFCFTVQEEVGCRGAKIAANRIMPDIGLVVEATTCSDIAGVAPHLEVTTLGGGAAISVLDRGSYSDVKLVKGLYQAAQTHDIPVQYKRTTMGGNDARSIQTAGLGVRVAAISVPCRYLHSPVSVVSKNDYLAVRNLAKLFLENAEEW